MLLPLVAAALLRRPEGPRPAGTVPGSASAAGLAERAPAREPGNASAGGWPGFTVPGVATEIDLPRGERGPLCLDGRLVPRLYLLGAMKSATTSLALALVQRGFISAGGAGTKEFHWFDRDRGLSSLHGVQARAAWAREGPACPAKYSVSADFTPLNLASEPVPPLLREYYGALAGELRFVVLLREPLERLQSNFYHILRKVEGRGRDVPEHVTFDAYVQRELGALAHNASATPARGLTAASIRVAGSDVERSLYYRNLRNYLEGPAGFAPRQFLVAPMRRFIAYPDETVQAVAASVHWPAERITAAPHANDGGPPAPPLAQDIAPGTRAQVERLFAADRAKLAALLFRGHTRGLQLLGFRGRSARDVDAWLTTWW